MADTLALWGFTLAALCAILLLVTRAPRKGLPLPPGPRPLPIIGNLADVPTKDGVTVFRDMNKKFGENTSPLSTSSRLMEDCRRRRVS